MSYQQHPGASDQPGRRQAPPYPTLLGTNGAPGGRAPAAGVYGMPQYTQQQTEGGYGGPPPSPVVNSWEGRGYVEDVGYMRQDPSLLSGAATPLASTTSGGGGEGGFLVSGSANTMGAPLQSFYPPSVYGLPTSMYPFQQPGAFPGAYPGSGGAGGGGAAGGAGSAGGGNFFGQGAYARSTNPGQPIQTTTNLQGPDGCNLFVFHIPNTMTNEALFRLFSKFGNVISARIMVEKATGRSRGFGFVSYDNRDSAEKAISQMNGYQIEHKRLKVQHKKDKERDRYVAAPSPRMMGPGPVAGRVQQPPQHYRQPLLPQHNAALRHSVGDDKPPPPSPATDTGSSGVAPGFTVTSANEEEHGEASTTEVGMDGSVDPTYGSGSSRPSADKYGRPNDHPHLAYIYHGRGTATREDDSGGFSSGGGDGKAAVGEEKPQDQDPSGYGGRDDSGYLGTAPAASVGGRAASPDPKAGVNRARSSSPSAAAAALPHQHQSLEHAMQTKLTIAGNGSPPASAQPS